MWLFASVGAGKLGTIDGFALTHQYNLRSVRCRHYVLVDPNRQGTVVPVHGSRDLQRKTLVAIMKQAGATEETFRRLLSRRLPS